MQDSKIKKSQCINEKDMQNEIEIVDTNVNMDSSEERPGVGYEIIGNSIGLGG